MSASMYSPAWYRVAEIRPRLRAHAEIHRHAYRGRIWYVLQDHSTGRAHRFTPAAYHLLGLMDGRRTLQQIWEAATEHLGDDAPSQEETIRFLGQLHAADVLQADVTPDSLELFRRHERFQGLRWKQRLTHPLAIRVPLLDPDRFLERWLPLVRPLFSWAGFAAWATLVLAAAVLAALHWPDLTEDIGARVLTPTNLAVLWLTYPLVKAVHELGHAFAAKHWGGEIHEMGVMFLVLMPVPYVEASSATAFREKRKRVVVDAAGIMVELFLASVALLVWLNVEPGAVRVVAYNVMLIGGVSTLFFNGNPLLRFDGYYILQDAIEIPNLASRSKRYLGYLAERHLFGVRDAPSPVTAPGEHTWLASYGVASFLYRLFIICVIVLFVAGELFFIGVILAIWAVFQQVLMPAARSLASVFTNPRLQRTRARAVTVSVALLAGAAVTLLLVPVPLATRAEGLVWLPEQSEVRAGADGFVVRLLAGDGDRVARGDPLLETTDPLLGAQRAVLEAQLDELEARWTAAQFVDQTGADVIRQEIATLRAGLARATERIEALVIRSPEDGVVMLPRAVDLPGRFVRRGELIGYVADPSDATVRVVVGQDEIGLVRERTLGVEARLARWEDEVFETAVRREVPAGSHRLPSRTLGVAGGGRFPVDPRDPDGVTTLERVFQLELALPPHAAPDQLGARVHVRFDHGSEPVALQLYRGVLQLFLARFGV